MNRKKRHDAKLGINHLKANVRLTNIPAHAHRAGGPMALMRVGVWQWRKGIHEFFDRSEQKVGMAHHWLHDRLERLRAVETKAEDAIDTSLALVVVAKMDIKRMVQDYKARSGRFKSKVIGARHRTDDEMVGRGVDDAKVENEALL